jgi:hypothetical protein
MATSTETRAENIVVGTVTDKLGRPLSNLVVHVYDRDMRDEQLLGECVTDRDGRYRIGWSHGQLSGRGKGSADIAIKVVTHEKKHLLFSSGVDDIRFNASPREQIDVTIATAMTPDVVEFDHIVQQVTFLAGAVAIADLQESRRYRDLTFLAQEAAIPADKIAHVVVAHRLHAESKIDAAFFYALLRKNTLLKSDLTKPAEIRLSVGIDTDTRPLLYDAALVDEQTIRRDVAAAVKDAIVSDQVQRGLDEDVKRLRAFRSEAEEYNRTQRPEKLLRVVSQFLLEDKLDEMAKLFEENKDNPAAFLGKLDSLSVAASDATIAGAHASPSMDDLQGLGKTEKVQPTAAFVAEMRGEKKPVLKQHEAISDFLLKHGDFDLARDNVATFLKHNPLTGGDTNAVTEELKSVQRVFKLVPHYGKTMALHQLGIQSSQAIVAAGKTRFVGEIAPKAGISADEASEIFAKAQQTTMAAMLIAGELQDTMRAMDMPAMEMKTLSLKLEAVSGDFPNLKSLFQTTDSCACAQCR